MELEMRKSSSRSSRSSSHSAGDDIPKEQVEVLIEGSDVQNASPDPGPGFDLRYKVEDIPPWYLCIFLGFQHYLTMFGSTASIALILAPSLCIASDGVAVSEILSTLFFVSGLVTVLQTTVGIRLPLVQGGAFSYLIPTFAILSLPKWGHCPLTAKVENPTAGCIPTSTVTSILANDTNTTELDLDEIWKPRMREVQGAIITASLFQILVGATGIVGFLMKYIGPLTIAPTIALIGMALFDVAADTCALQWGFAMLTMVLIALFSQYLRNIDLPVFVPTRKDGKKFGCRKTTYPVFKMFPIILAILSAWFLCYILTVTDAIKNDKDAIGYNARTDLKSSVLYKASWFRFPYPFQWGLPTFSIAGTLGMIAGVMAGMLESVGDYYACARLSGAPPPPTHAINRGILMEGLGCVLSGMWGSGSGSTSYSENIGAIGITKVGSRRVIQTAGLVMMVLGVFGKFGALFVTIPSPIVGGVFMVMFGVITAVGISNLQYADLNSSRNLFIFGFAILFGLSVPKWVNNHADEISSGIDLLDQIVLVLLKTSMFLGGCIAFILDNTVPGSLEERGIIKWRSELEESSADSTDDKVLKCYEIPYLSKPIRKYSWTKYIPFLPTFPGEFNCQSKCRRRSKQEKYSVSEADSMTNADGELNHKHS